MAWVKPTEPSTDWDGISTPVGVHDTPSESVSLFSRLTKPPSTASQIPDGNIEWGTPAEQGSWEGLGNHILLEDGTKLLLENLQPLDLERIPWNNHTDTIVETWENAYQN